MKRSVRQLLPGKTAGALHEGAILEVEHSGRTRRSLAECGARQLSHSWGEVWRRNRLRFFFFYILALGFL